MKGISEILIKKYDLEIGSFYFYANFVIGEIKEGIITTHENSRELFLIGKEYYGLATPFVYISNRVNSYSFDPTGHYKSMKLFPNLKGFAVVAYNIRSEKVANLEQVFIDVPTKIFNNLKSAVHWAEQLTTINQTNS